MMATKYRLVYIKPDHHKTENYTLGMMGASLRVGKIFTSMIILKMEIPSRIHQSRLTLGQGGNPKTDACKTNKENGCDKHKGNMLEVNSDRLSGKYQKISYEKNICRPTKENASKSPPARRKSEDRVSERRSLTSRIHILLLVHRCRCRGYLTAPTSIHIHRGEGMIQGCTIYLALSEIFKLL
jgi:hypothetical protein